jgi:hypothetical protein
LHGAGGQRLARSTIDGQPLLSITTGSQIQKMPDPENMKYAAANIQGMPEYATMKVSSSTVGFYNAQSLQKIGLIRAGPPCTLGLCGKQFDFYTYDKVCSTQTASAIPDAVAPVFKRFSMTRNIVGFTQWVVTHVACDGEEGEQIWSLAEASWKDYSFNINEGTSEMPVGAIVDKNGIAILADPATSTYNVWLADGQDQALGVLVGILANFQASLEDPDTPVLANPAPNAATPAAHPHFVLAVVLLGPAVLSLLEI